MTQSTATMTRAQIGAEYLDLVGYDIALDDASATRDELAQWLSTARSYRGSPLLADLVAVGALEAPGNPCPDIQAAICSNIASMTLAQSDIDALGFEPVSVGGCTHYSMTITPDLDCVISAPDGGDWQADYWSISFNRLVCGTYADDTPCYTITPN